VELALSVRDDLFNPAITGAIQGAVYGLLGLGLVLLYKGNRIFNFAQGEFGTVAALTTFAFATGFGSAPETPYAVAVLAGLLAGTLFGLLTERLVARPLFRQPKVTTVVATAGVALLAIAVELMIFGTNPFRPRPIVEGTVVRSGGLTITKQQVIILVVLAVLAVASALFFSRTQAGLAVLAVSQ
jgi:branched-chain amino acid transport system permease protein